MYVYVMCGYIALILFRTQQNANEANLYEQSLRAKVLEQLSASYIPGMYSRIYCILIHSISSMSMPRTPVRLGSTRTDVRIALGENTREPSEQCSFIDGLSWGMMVVMCGPPFHSFSSVRMVQSGKSLTLRYALRRLKQKYNPKGQSFIEIYLNGYLQLDDTLAMRWSLMMQLFGWFISTDIVADAFWNCLVRSERFVDKSVWKMTWNYPRA